MATPETAVKKVPKDYQTTAASWWCPGCGDFGVLAALQRALANMGIPNEKLVTVSGIGCSGKISGYVKSFGYHSLHGRALPPAQAIKLANKELTVVAVGGDGDGYGIGAGHFVHAVRRNVDVCYIVMDNSIYGLTKGQVSPTSQLGFVTPTTPSGSIETPLNPLALYLSAGGTFLAQGFSGDMKGLVELIEKGVQHKGFALINVFSPCVTFNKTNTYAWYREVLKDVNADGTHDPSDKMAAMAKVMSGTVYKGLLYQEERKDYTSQVKGLQGPPLADLELDGIEYEGILEEFQ